MPILNAKWSWWETWINKQDALKEKEKLYHLNKIKMREIKMREIKFEYIFDDYNWRTFKKIFKLEDMEETQSLFYNYAVLGKRQYTWFKDKNWKEIYEWDIINRWDILYKVKYKSWWFHITNKCNFKMFKWKSDIAQNTYFIWIFNTRKLEVIWNIYENPDLI